MMSSMQGEMTLQLDEKEERDKISKQYEMFEADKKRRLKESSSDNENEE